MPLRDADGTRVAARFAEAFLDDKSCAPGVRKVVLVTVLFPLLVAAESPLLCANFFGPIVRHFFQRSGGLLQLRLHSGFLFRKERSQSFTLGLVPLLEDRTGFFVVAFDRTKSVVGDSSGDQIWRRTEKAVTDANVVVEKRKRLSWVQRVKP